MEPVSAEEAAKITAYLDVHAPPSQPTAHIIFGTNQLIPAEVAARQYHRGLASLIILTGGVNRHTGVIEAEEHRRILLERDVPEPVIRYEARSTTTQGNVEQALPLLREILASNMSLTAVCKWYHRRAIQQLRAALPEAPCFYAVTWEPHYGGHAVTRNDWWTRSSVGAQRVLREWRTIPARLATGSLKEVNLVNGTWR
ncbi:YdcF family protein [Pseudonocardia acaciae]|uniref:YdcF family protein n=1 Tax=Pseudonocardia acaciae TaxID=551276 RepID=UPI000A05416E|nr:YdcF family protein [Pseudonocardia acaciae]